MNESVSYKLCFSLIWGNILNTPIREGIVPMWYIHLSYGICFPGVPWGYLYFFPIDNVHGLVPSLLHFGGLMLIFLCFMIILPFARYVYLRYSLREVQ